MIALFREEMLNLLKTALFSSGVEEEADEGIKDLIEMTMKKMDDDKDGKVSFEDFQICVKNNPLMLEAFGPCLPTGKVIWENSGISCDRILYRCESILLKFKPI